MKIGYVGLFNFPDGDAGAFHVLGIGKALRECGHSVVFFGIEHPLQPSLRLSGHATIYDASSYAGFKYISEPLRIGKTNLKRWGSIISGLPF